MKSKTSKLHRVLMSPVYTELHESVRVSLMIKAELLASIDESIVASLNRRARMVELVDAQLAAEATRLEHVKNDKAARTLRRMLK